MTGAENPSQTRLVHYSLYLCSCRDHRDLLEQLEASLASLRHHNQIIPVAVMVHGPFGAELAAIGQTYRAALVQRSPYRQQLSEIVPLGAPSLGCYPLLHKFMNFDALEELAVTQALFVDCDTLFFDDVGGLFDRYLCAGHVVAREEPNCRRSPHGYDPTYLDEDALRGLTNALGLAPVAPFNTGVVLFNNLPWALMAEVGRQSVRIAWRLLLGCVAGGRHLPPGPYGPSEALTELATRFDGLDPAVRAQALPFPSPNHWILDEVSLWLALGQLPGLVTADFSPTDVLQNGELFSQSPDSVGGVLCHYYSQNTERVRAWANGDRVRF